MIWCRVWNVRIENENKMSTLLFLIISFELFFKIRINRISPSLGFWFTSFFIVFSFLFLHMKDIFNLIIEINNYYNNLTKF